MGVFPVIGATRGGGGAEIFQKSREN